MSGSQRTSAVRSVNAADQRPTIDELPVVEARSETGADQTAAHAADGESAVGKKKRRPVLPVILAALVIGAGWFGYGWWTEGRFMVSTDDAYIDGDIAIISPKVSGYVKAVNVVSNQHVKAGDPLVTLDDGDYRIAAEQAKAQIAIQKLTLQRIDAQVKGGEAALAQADAQKRSAQATLSLAELSFTRVSGLQEQKVASTADLDSARTQLEQAKANLTAADANIAAADAQISVLKAQRAESEGGMRSAELALEKAERDLAFTVLKAPYDGVVGNLSVQTGDLVSIGKRLAALVPVEELYIEANFKETQIAELVPGSKVSIHVDAYGDKPIEGTVTSIAPASGSVFSMLPAENATGNFTKVVQRVPVRIAIPKDVLASGHLRAGLSVIVDVDTRTAPNGAALAAN
ncbi:MULTISPECIES: HlyD family secretion protein [Alphaproteobacteria]|uniref:Hemolysin D n=2 Tax=Alphaproteobacteria TaxID=28211 RepID=A0A512HJ16_9HYPH|nr:MULTISPECIES: HlyD family secretion protein [Alphaproteobacteria]GEO85449.1 hemolysin D [Ciceribacter naphthalenivorans]GLR21529.1 hemolysin D [Ciceribacter naphthalenivorans]GLT04385.1 hemolysin D [Sphingomonas psychrolutea]